MSCFAVKGVYDLLHDKPSQPFVQGAIVRPIVADSEVGETAVEQLAGSRI